jgi:hypothetical protein
MMHAFTHQQRLARDLIKDEFKDARKQTAVGIGKRRIVFERGTW